MREGTRHHHREQDRQLEDCKTFLHSKVALLAGLRMRKTEETYLRKEGCFEVEIEELIDNMK